MNDDHKSTIPGRCVYCSRSIMWSRGMPLCCDTCFPRYEAESNEMAECVERYKLKDQKAKAS